MPDDHQIYYVFSRITPSELGPRRTFITRTGRAGSVSPYCHGFNLIDARTFASKTEARVWFECRRPEVQEAMTRDGFKLTEIRAEVVTPSPALKLAGCPESPMCPDCEAKADAEALGLPVVELVEPGLHPNERIGLGPGNLIVDDAPDFDQWPTDEELDMLAAVGALEDTLDGALDDASDQLAAETLGMPIETFRGVLARAAADAEAESTSTAEAEERERQLAYGEAVRDFRQPPEGEACVGDGLCGCKRCKTEFAATN